MQGRGGERKERERQARRDKEFERRKSGGRRRGGKQRMWERAAQRGGQTLGRFRVWSLGKGERAGKRWEGRNGCKVRSKKKRIISYHVRSKKQRIISRAQQ